MIEDGEDTDDIPYQEAVGLLFLVQGTRPDMAFAVNDVSRFNSRFGRAPWTAIKRIMRYLKGTVNHKILFCYTDSSRLYGFCDADWASDVDKRRSCTGYIFKLGSGAVSWASKRQPTIALSTTEAEYIAMSAATQEAIWLRQFYRQFRREVPPTIINCDNQSAIAIAKEDSYRANTKHIDVRYHHVRDRITKGDITRIRPYGRKHC